MRGWGYMPNNSAIDLAQKCSAIMHEKDHMSQTSGMSPKSLGPGEAEVVMVVSKHMLNGLGMCHGGMIFSLADTAFAHACNNQNKANVAIDCRIDFLRPCFEGDNLVATARRKHSGKNSGLYEVVITNQKGKEIALFQGRSFSINKTVINEKL